MSTSTHGSLRERCRILLLLRQPKLWPAWPFLPLVRRKPGQEEECGVLCDVLNVTGRPGCSATVFLANLFKLPHSEAELLKLPREVYDSPEEILAAGWGVD